MELNTQQRNKLQKLLKAHEGGTDAIMQFFFELQDEIDAVKGDIPSINDLIKRMKGDPGDTPTREYLLDLIYEAMPEIQNPEPGKPGKDADEEKIRNDVFKQVKKMIPTADEIAKKVTIPPSKNVTVIEKVDESAIVQALYEKLIENMASFAADYRDGLELLDEDNRLDISAIKGLDDYNDVLKAIKELRATPHRMVGKGRLAQMNDVAIKGITNGQTLIWNTATQNFIPGSASVDLSAYWKKDGSSGGATGDWNLNHHYIYNLQHLNLIDIADGTSNGEMLLNDGVYYFKNAADDPASLRFWGLVGGGNEAGSGGYITYYHVNGGYDSFMIANLDPNDEWGIGGGIYLGGNGEEGYGYRDGSQTGFIASSGQVGLYLGGTAFVYCDAGGASVGHPSLAIDIYGSAVIINQYLRHSIAGTAALPVITPEFDTNNGKWFPAADTQAWSTAGIEAMRLDPNQRLSVKTGVNTSKKSVVGGKIKEFFTSVGNGTTVETDLYSYTTEANLLGTNGDEFDGSIGGTFVSSGTATRQLKLKFAGTTIFDSGTLSVSTSASWVLSYSIIRVSSTVIRYRINLSTQGAALSAYTSVGELTGLTLSSTNILKITGQAAGVGAASNDIVAMNGDVFWWPVSI